MKVYMVDHAAVRFWESHDPKDAQKRRGDDETVCEVCLSRMKLLPSHVGVRRVTIQDLDDVTDYACQRCGEHDTEIHQLLIARRW